MMSLTEDQRTARILGDAIVAASDAHAGAYALADVARRLLRRVDAFRVRPWRDKMILPGETREGLYRREAAKCAALAEIIERAVREAREKGLMPDD